MPLDTTPLANAVARLEEGLARYRSDTTDTQIRDGPIQRFELAPDVRVVQEKGRTKVGRNTPRRVRQVDHHPRRGSLVRQ
jgi:hypothetical protein